MAVIHLLRIGAVSIQTVHLIAEGIEYHLGISPTIHSDILDPGGAFDPNREQYHATRLLENLETYAKSTHEHLLGLTNVDLFIPILTFVFGEARLNHPCAILSLHRLSPTVYGLPDNPTQTLRRATTEALHELGHTFGLIHCPNYQCVMHASRLADDIDLKGPSFCQECATSLHPHQLNPRIIT